MSSRRKNQFGDHYVIEGLLEVDGGWQGSIAWIIHDPQTGSGKPTPPLTMLELYDSKEAAEEACREFADKIRPE